MAEYSADVIELGDKIASLTLVKAVEVKNYLKEKYNIEPAAGGAVMAVAAGPAPVAPAAEAAKPEKMEFTVQLEGYDDAKKIQVIKVVREITGLGLKEAKDLVEGAKAGGKPVKENIDKAEAEKHKKALEDVGAKVSLK